MENKEKFTQLMQDEEFITALLELQTPKEVQDEFKSHGVELSLDDVNKIVHDLDSITNLVTDEELENISGGALPTSNVVSTIVAHYADKSLENGNEKK